MIRKVVFASVWASVLLGGTAALSGARAMPEQPFATAPLLYDARNALIGPLVSGYTYITLDGQFYMVSVKKARLGKIWSLFYYRDKACKTQAFLDQQDMELTPRIIPWKGDLYIPYDAPEFVEVKAYRSVNDYGWDTSCRPTVRSKTMLPLRKEPEAFLGISFPVRAERER